VLLPVQSKASGSQSALAELRKIYCYEIYAFVRRGHDAYEAQNRTQGFFLHPLDHKAVQQVNPLRANSVHFLKASLQTLFGMKPTVREASKEVETLLGGR
jgi:hypothetical protein